MVQFRLCFFVFCTLISACSGATLLDAQTLVDLILGEQSLLHSLVHTQTKVDPLGGVHYYFEQRYLNTVVPVLGGHCIVHFHPDGTQHITNDLQPITSTISIIPTVILAPLLVTISLLLGFLFGFPFAPLIDLIVVPTTAGLGWLAYRVVVPLDGLSNALFFINALTGAILNLGVTQYTATGVPTLYDGNISFNEYYYSRKFYMEDVGNKTGVFDCNGGTCSGTLSGYRLFTFNNVWTEPKHKQAANVIWGATKTLQYFKNVFNRNGLNGTGGPAIVTTDGSTTKSLFPHYVRVGGSGYINDAVWTPNGIYYGSGDGVNYGPMVSLDIVAHEMMHGILSYEVGLNYNGQSGAIEESWCDVFAAMVERYVFGESDNVWTFGEDVYTPNIPNDAIRYLKNPSLGGQPDHMSDYNNSTTDNHINSGIPSKAFDLFANGGDHRGGHTDGVGVDDAALVWYYAMQYYMTPSTDFMGARSATMLAVRLIAPVTDYRYTAIQNAWALVGVGGAPILFANESIANGALEQNALPWVMPTSNSVVYIKSGTSYKSARGYMMMGCVNNGNGSAYQSIGSFSVNAVYANLTFWLSVSTGDSATVPKDFLTVRIYDLSTDEVLQVLETYTNTIGTTDYSLKGPFDMMAYRGRSNLAVVFSVTTDENNPTTFKIDDVSMKIGVY